MKNWTIAAVAALALTGCDKTADTPADSAAPAAETGDPADAEAPQGPVLFRGIGQEPGWIVRIYGNVIVYEGDYGETLIAVRAPEPETTDNGRRYVTAPLTVEIAEEACTDVMSAAEYPATVTIIEGERTWQGCGGDIAEGESDAPAPPPAGDSPAG